ncbi:cytochrome P450 [Streptomyces sp. NPDC054844]
MCSPHLLTDRDQHDSPLTDTQICDQVSSLFLAGVETTATVISWALHMMTQHPDVQQQVHEEATAVLQEETPHGQLVDQLGPVPRVLLGTARTAIAWTSSGSPVTVHCYRRVL